MKKITILILLLLTAAIPLVVWFAQREQDIRQEATGEDVALYFTTPTSATPLTQLNPSGIQSLRLYLNTRAANVNSFDISIQFPAGITLQSIDEGSGAQNFEDLLFKDVNPQSNRGQFAKANLNTGRVIRSSALHLATLNFTVGTSPTGAIEIVSAFITSPSNQQASLSIERPPLPIGTITPTSGTPTLGINGVALSIRAFMPAGRSQTKDVIVTLTSANAGTLNQEFTSSGTLTKGAGNIYTGTVNVNNLATGTYQIKEYVDNYAQKLVGKETNQISHTLTAGQTYAVPQVNLLVGDADDDRRLTINDYNRLVSCMRSQGGLVDFDEDGACTGIDLNLFLIGVRQGD